MSLMQAVKQGVVASAICYGFDYYSGYNYTYAGLVTAALAGMGDYYGKTLLLPKLDIATGMAANPMSYKSYAVGAATAGAVFAGVASASEQAGDLKSEFLRGAMYGVASDIVLKFVDPFFVSSKFFDVASSASAAISSQLSSMEYKSTSDI